MGDVNLQLLPNEMLHKIFGFIERTDIAHCALVCRRWNGLIRSPLFLRDFLQRKYPAICWSAQEVSEFEITVRGNELFRRDGWIWKIGNPVGKRLNAAELVILSESLDFAILEGNMVNWILCPDGFTMCFIPLRYLISQRLQMLNMWLVVVSDAPMAAFGMFDGNSILQVGFKYRTTIYCNQVPEKLRVLFQPAYFQVLCLKVKQGFSMWLELPKEKDNFEICYLPRSLPGSRFQEFASPVPVGLRDEDEYNRRSLRSFLEDEYFSYELMLRNAYQ